MKFTKEDKILGFGAFFLLVVLTTCKLPEIKSTKPCIMPDYRPGFDCLRFDKLP